MRKDCDCLEPMWPIAYKRKRDFSVWYRYHNNNKSETANTNNINHKTKTTTNAERHYVSLGPM